MLRTTGLSHRLFWEVPEGLGAVGLSDGPKEDRVQVQCVFQGGWPASLTVGASCRIEGTFRGVIATAGVPLLVDCELADEG
jgi:hypothetical protein